MEKFEKKTRKDFHERRKNNPAINSATNSTPGSASSFKFSNTNKDKHTQYTCYRGDHHIPSTFWINVSRTNYEVELTEVRENNVSVIEK